MVSPLSGSLARIIGKAAAPYFLDATLTRDVQGIGSDPADPPAPTQVTYTCKAIEQEYSAGLRGQGLVGATDIEVLILANSISVEPKPLDRITIRGMISTIVPANASGMKAVRGDPARATWLCRTMGAVPAPVEAEDESATFDSSSSTFDDTSLTWDQAA